MLFLSRTVTKRTSFQLLEYPTTASMSSKESPKKGAGAGSTTDIDTLMPLLFAVHPEVKPNYKKMSAIDEYKRTAAALEHKFRKWRHKGVEIAAAHPEECSTKELVGTPAKTKMPRTKTAPLASEDKGSDAAENEDCVPKVCTDQVPLIACC